MKTYKWTIVAMDTAPSEEGLTDVVKVVHWQYSATEDAYIANIYGAMSCSTPSETDFTAYPELTEEKVIGWLEAGLDVPVLQSNLDAQIENQKNPPIVNLPLPWAPVPVLAGPTSEPAPVI